MTSNWISFAVLVFISLVLRCDSTHDSAATATDHSAPWPHAANMYPGFDDDYIYPDTTDSVPSILITPAQSCDYDHCRDQQVPCVELSALTGCRCPGQSGPHEVPEAPFVRAVVSEGPLLVVHWCAPPSSVTSYRVVAGGREVGVMGERSRRAPLPRLEPGTGVCVEALNLAGSSSPTKSSCVRYDGDSDSLLTLKVGLLVGALLFLLLLLSLVVFLLWRYKARRSRARSPSHSAGQGSP